jgi:hypothetical protein
MKIIMNEIWKDIKGYEGLYQVSNFGNVKTLSRFKNGYMTKTRLLKHTPYTNGYYMVTLVNGINRKKISIHRLVAQAFISNPDNKPEVNHFNGIKTDNRVENLEWCTHIENQKHASINSLYLIGEKHPNSILTQKDVNEIRKIGKNKTLHELGKLYGVTYSTIWRVLKYKIWK